MNDKSILLGIVLIIILTVFSFFYVFAEVRRIKYKDCVPSVTFISTEESVMHLMDITYSINTINMPRESYALCLSDIDSTSICTAPNYFIYDIPVNTTFQLTGNVRAVKPLVDGLSFNAYNKYWFEGHISDDKAGIWISHSTLAKFQSDEINSNNNDLALQTLGYTKSAYTSKLKLDDETWTCQTIKVATSELLRSMGSAHTI